MTTYTLAISTQEKLPWTRMFILMPYFI